MLSTTNAPTISTSAVGHQPFSDNFFKQMQQHVYWTLASRQIDYKQNKNYTTVLYIVNTRATQQRGHGLQQIV